MTIDSDTDSAAGFSARIGHSRSLLCLPLPLALTEQAVEGHPTCLAKVTNKTLCNQPKPLYHPMQPKAMLFSLLTLSSQKNAAPPFSYHSHNCIFSS